MAADLPRHAFDASTWGGDDIVLQAAQERFGSCFHIVGLDVLLDESGVPWLLEVNCNPSLGLDEVRPLDGVKTQAEVNQLFAAAKRERSSGGYGGQRPSSRGPPSKWGRPCRCMQHPRPHSHHRCPVDAAVKVPMVSSALTIVGRARAGAPGGPATWADGTIFQWVADAHNPRSPPADT